MSPRSAIRVPSLVVLVALCCLHDAAATPFPVGINIDPSNPDGNPSVATIAATGASWVRIEYKTVSVQAADRIPSATSAPSRAGSSGIVAGKPGAALPDYLTIIHAFNAAGIRTLVILDYMTVPNTPWGGTDAQWAAYISTFVAEVRSIAQSLPTMNGGFEIWNEEDLTQTLVPSSSYATMLQQSYEAIKGVNASLEVVMGGLASGDPSYVSQVVSASGGVLYADQIGLHPYGQRPYPDWPSPTWGFGFMGDLVNAYAAAVSPLSARIVITEMGTNDVSVEGPFPWMLFTALSTDMAPRVTACIWFCWSDGMVSPFGLVTAAQQPKADYASFTNFTMGNR